MRFKAEARGAVLPELFWRWSRVRVRRPCVAVGELARASAWQRYAGRTERERGGLEAG